MITSTSSSQVKHVLQLQKKSKARKEFREFVVEGHKMVTEAPIERVAKVYASETFANNNDSLIRNLINKKIEVETVSDGIFEKMSDTQTPQGIMAVVKMADITLEDILNSKSTPLVLLIENLQDPGNLGTIIRMGEGAGATGVIMSSNTVDIYNPKTIRSTMGSIYRVPFAYAEDFAEVLKQCKNKKIRLFAAHLDGENAYNKDYSKPTAFLIGNEGNGLTDETSKMADELIKIPMAGQVESLNAAIACTILAFEAVRQRING
ncbi:MAG: TrmH family RNA methyltransferase [Lachnospira sp.]